MFVVRQIPMEKNFRSLWFFFFSEQKKRKEVYYTITVFNVFLNIICRIDVFRMFVTWAKAQVQFNEIREWTTRARDKKSSIEWSEKKQQQDEISPRHLESPAKVKFYEEKCPQMLCVCLQVLVDCEGGGWGGGTKRKKIGNHSEMNDWNKAHSYLVSRESSN